ncbi:LptF/LptG family permease [Lentisphaerota bacterium WC36G]|nr:LptF/LptG family permease [Lentisphaerae bacterium WC36]
MKTLNLYVSKSFLVTFLSGIGILTFFLVGARLYKIINKLMEGVPLFEFFLMIAYMMPVVLSFTIPFAMLVAVMLIFGRLSADNEITAMRACGVSITQIIAPILLLAYLLSALCLYLQLDIGPRFLGEGRAMLKNVGRLENPTAIIEPGRSVSYENYVIYIGEKDGDKLADVQLMSLDSEKNIEADITASTGSMSLDKKKKIIGIHLYNGQSINKPYTKNKSTTRFEELTINIDYGKQLANRKLSFRSKYMNTTQLFAQMQIHRKNGMGTTELELEMNRRIAMALAPIAFVLLGLPLAIRTSRRETSVGLFLGIILSVVYFMAIIIFLSLESKPGIYPQYLLWIPCIVYQIVGVIMIYRIAHR